MKFLADMGISPRVVAALRRQGHDALDLQEQDLGDMLDPEILAKVHAEGRILLTHDLDFGQLRARSPSSLRTRRSCGFSPLQNAHVSKPSSISPLAIRKGHSVCKLAAVGWDESLDLNPAPLLRYRFTGHAKIEMRRRGITEADISAALSHPE